MKDTVKPTIETEEVPTHPDVEAKPDLGALPTALPTDSNGPSVIKPEVKDEPM